MSEDRRPVIGGTYRHFKGNIYKLLFIAHDSEDQDILLAIYMSLSLCEDTKIWVRPLIGFMSEVDHEKYPNVEQKYRFELVNDNSSGER